MRVKPENWLENGLVKNHQPRPPILKGDTLYDIGAGIRPLRWGFERHVCVEPCEQYYGKLVEAGFDAIQDTAHGFLLKCPSVDVIAMMDVIEHMEKDVALECLRLAKLAAKQVVIYTPLGFMEQTDDGWGLGEDEWQTHRSGWRPEEFPDWITWRHARGFVAVFTK